MGEVDRLRNGESREPDPPAGDAADSVLAISKIEPVSPGRIIPDAEIRIVGSGFGPREEATLVFAGDREATAEILDWKEIAEGTEIRARVPGLARLDPFTGPVVTVVLRTRSSEARMPLRLVELRSSITTWTRLEAHARTQNLEEGLRRGLEARVHDALWLLARQWQFREFDGEDAGSPVEVRVQGEAARLSRWRPGSEGDPRDLPAGPPLTPLETLVERERAQTQPEAGWDRRFAAEAGLHFLRLLARRVQHRQRLARYRAEYRELYPLQLPPPTERAEVDADSLRFLELAAERAPDGAALATALRVALPPTSTLPDEPRIHKQDEAAVLRAIVDWFRWSESFVSQAPAAEAAPERRNESWDAERMEYAFAVAANTSDGEVVLTAQEHTGGRLDWHSFAVDEGGALGAPPRRRGIDHTVLPTLASYPGMPAARWWRFENRRVDFGAVTASPAELGHVLFVEFVTAYGTDWFVTPVEPVDVGSLVRLGAVTVKNTFGETLTLQPFSRTSETGGRWRMFELSGSDAASPLFFLAPALPTGLESAPLEEVLLLRDELANMAWAVERVVKSETGRPLDRFEAYQARLEQERRSGEAPSAQRLAYRLATTVPDNWNPLLRQVLDARRRLGLAAMRNEKGELLRPLGELLRPEGLPRPLALYDEEVPAAGARVTRAYEYARSADGSTYLWVSRRKRPGPGQASSGLRFDDLGPM
jgi:hypothetical protein